MSNDVFPVLAGLTFPFTRAPVTNTLIQTAVDLSELRATFMTAPVYDYSLSYDILRADSHAEFSQLVGFWEAHLGSWDSFLFTDPSDANVSAQVFGTGNGVAANFQLIRTLGTANAPVKNLNNAPTITVNNTPTSNFTVSSGLVTFTSPPAANAVLRWTGTYYLRARFGADTQEFEQFMRLFWQVGTLKLRATLGNNL
jgi:uncharacterized protein (TIGR02217 family)